MKTTIDIPDDLYKKAKIRAVEEGMTLKQVVLNSLARELKLPESSADPPSSYWANREYLPNYQAAQKAGAFRPKAGDRDVTDLISKDRDAR